MKTYRYIDMTGEEIAALDRSKTIIVLPVGSSELHGLQLPLDTDTLPALHLAEAIADGSHGCLLSLAPPFRYTSAKPSGVYPGTLSIAGETLIKLTRDVIASFMQQGFDKILILNAHMENTDFMIEGISLALDQNRSATIILANWWELVTEEDLIRIFGSDWRGWVDEHAALMETSLVQFMAPQLVREDKMMDDARKTKFEFRIFPWDLKNYPASGVFAPTRGASRQKGEQLIRLVVQALGRLVEDHFRS